MTPQQIDATKTCLSECQALIAEGESEARVCSAFTSRLRAMGGADTPWWVDEHIKKTQALSHSIRGGRMSAGFVDNKVGLTVIEYEKNLTVPAIRSTGFNQVLDYLAGLLNTGAPMDNVIGVLSDTVRWEAYEVISVNHSAALGSYSASDLTVNKIESINCRAADDAAARTLLGFLERHLGRNGGQILAAATLTEYLGLEARNGQAFFIQAEQIVDSAFAANPGYASLIQTLWADFVSFVGDSRTARTFDKKAYAGELYILTLAKLIAANVISETALISNVAELEEILNGSFFLNKGFENLVEYDYFGWLTKSPHVSGLRSIAAEIQKKLQIYEFRFIKPEDIFGQIIAQLAQETQRILLGQECTPSWLVKQVVDKVITSLPTEQPWRLVDTCCGSGAFVVEVVSRRMTTLPSALNKEDKIRELCQAITGFDIDPLAVMLAKVSWLVSAKSILAPFDGTYKISLPIYHADSLFAISPLSESVQSHLSSGVFRLKIDTKNVDMPAYLAEPTRQPLFDQFIDGLYELAKNATLSTPPRLNIADVHALLRRCCSETGVDLNQAEQVVVENFGIEFGEVVANLEAAGRNGLWVYVLKNTYRPALVKAKFTGLVTNLPWLALSKLANNPYTKTVKGKAAEFNIRAPGATFLHAELATVFLLHAVRHYLADGASVGAIVPNTVFQGSQHEPFRRSNYRIGSTPIPFMVKEVWDVDKAAFDTNLAAVIIGKKSGHTVPDLKGSDVSETEVSSYPLYLSLLGDRSAWAKIETHRPGAAAYSFAQGVDVMPRAVWFHETSLVIGPGGGQVVQVRPISNASSAWHYLINDSKKCEDFRASTCTIDAKWAFPVLLSKHLAPFNIAVPALALLPFEKNNSGPWGPASSASLSLDRTANRFFSRAFEALEAAWDEQPIDSNVVFQRVTTDRNKLATHLFPATGYLVVFGAGGSNVCAAYVDLSQLDHMRLLVDQTLYWKVVTSENEACFLTGLLNSTTVSSLIAAFQPKGQQGERHIHTLAQQVLPQWDATDSNHMAVLTTTRQLISQLVLAVAAHSQGALLLDPSTNLNSRRKKLSTIILSLSVYSAYENACKAVLA